MFINDYSSYKTFLDLKNYLYNTNCLDTVELDYFYFEYQNAHTYHINKYSTKAHIHITRDIESNYTSQKYGYIYIYILYL